METKSGDYSPTFSKIKNHMWVQPRPTVAKETLYKVLEKNEFFEMLQHISTTNNIVSFLTSAIKKVSIAKSAQQPHSYRIVLTDNNFHAVAVAET